MSVHSKFKHDGKNYTIEVGEEGRFSSIIGDGEQIYHDTLKGLQDKIVRMTRRAAVRIALPATLVRASRRHWSSRDANSTTSSGS